MWPFSDYPELSPSQVDGHTYDYIIIGGGTAGCAVASLLSEDPKVSVLVIEKGHVKDSLLSRIPLASQAFQLADALQIQSSRWSEPLPGPDGRRNRLWGVEGMGGATRINGMVWTRGIPGDYAAWAEMGLDDWGWDKVEPYFRRMENTVSRPDSAARGHSGPIDLRICSQGFQWEPYLEKAMSKVGLPVGHDCNSPASPAMGFFETELAINAKGERISSLKAFLGKRVALERKSHLGVCTGAVVSRLELDGANGVAKGAHVRDVARPGSKDGFVRARREIIICSGALATPQLLMLSGIGPRTTAGNDLGIPLVKELPAVGAKLKDHYSFPIMLRLPQKETLHIVTGIWGLWYFLLWILFGAGLMSMGSTTTTAFVRLDAIDDETMQVKSRDDDGDGSDNMDAGQSRNVPDVEIMTIPVSSFQDAPPPGNYMFSLFATLVQPHGSGRLELLSRDPLVHPRITLPMHLDQRDTVSARRAARFTMRIAEEFQQSGYPHAAPVAFAPGKTSLDLLDQWQRTWAGSHGNDETTPEHKPSSVAAPPGDDDEVVPSWRSVTDDEIDDYVARVSHTSLHYASTCAMANDEATGVVDQQLRVHGFRNLRVADASVIPRTPSAHPMAAILMIAQRCAEFVQQEWQSKKTQ